MSVSDSNNNIRIRTTPLGSDRYVKINLNQNFDFLEILSLKIGQQDVYRKYCSDYGVIVGRVICNNGVGVPNAKISIFIPISDEDQENPKIRAIYPFTNVNDLNSLGVRYNLLPETPLVDDICYTEIGSFPEKRRILDCEPWCEIYGKYYKYTTTTNNSGDYIIFGVPTGLQTVHMDVDLSDIGYLSQKPYDMIHQGSSPDLFESYNKFKQSTILSQLPQIKTQNKTINVAPFWGNLDQCEVGINRVDFDLQYKIDTTAFFIGSIFGDSEKNSVNKSCRPRKNLGRLDQLVTGPGTIKMIRRTPFGGTESFSLKGDQLIDNDGTWVVQLPMNLDYKITDEFGNLIDSGSPEQGIATSAKYRFMITMNDYGAGQARLRARANYLVPNYGDYSFDDTTPDFITSGPTASRPNFAELKWNGVYTVRQFISRYSNRNESTCKDNNFIGIKDVTANGNNNLFPYNRADANTNPLYIILCLILVLISYIVAVVNIIISAFNSFLLALANICLRIRSIGLQWCPFGFLKKFTIGCLVIDLCDRKYAPSCKTPKPGQQIDDNTESGFRECIQASLAEALGIFSFYFTNDWINGALFAFLFKIKFKKKRSPKFCKANEPNGSNQFIKDQVCVNDGRLVDCADVVYSTRQGVIKYVDSILYYAATIENTILFPTDIYDLGSMKNCDYYGRPKTAVFLPPTTFNLPDLEEDPNDAYQDGEKGIDDLLLEFDCLGVKENATQCVNLARICELYVDPDYIDPEPIDINSIDDEDDREVRINLECLNSGQCNLSIANNDGGFGSDWNKYRTTYVVGTNTPYSKRYVYSTRSFSESTRNSLQQQQLVNNSFYFYFGLKAGSTAIDKLKSKYFAPCERKEPCPISISAIIKNNECPNGATGELTAIAENGTPPYKYQWFAGNYQGNSLDVPLCSVPSTTCDHITGLSAGTYTVVVYDNVGQICKKTFSVADPTPFFVSVDYSQYICPNSNNGYISVIPSGGVPPYNITWYSPPNGADVTINNTGNTGSFYVTNLNPTSFCNNSGITINTNSTTNYVNNGDFSNGFSYWTYTGMISHDNTNNCALFAGRAVISQNISGVIPCPSSFPCYLLTFTLSNFNPAQGFVNLLVDGNLIATYTNGGTYTVDLNSVSIISFEGGGTTTNQYVYTCLSNVSVLRKNQLVTNAAQFYNALITDSSPASCPNSVNIIVDISVACQLSISANTIDDYCTNIVGNKLGSGSITWGPLSPLGVPPFTYILDSTDVNFHYTGVTSDREKTIEGLLGGTCPGFTYTATCIDSCGFSATLVTELYKCDGLKSGNTFFNSWVRTITNAISGTVISTVSSTTRPHKFEFPSNGFFGSPGYNWYYVDFVGCSGTYELTDCANIGQDGYWGWIGTSTSNSFATRAINNCFAVNGNDSNGSIYDNSYVFGSNYNTNGSGNVQAHIDLSHFHILGSVTPGNPARLSFWDRGMGLDITRTSIVGTDYDEIIINYYSYTPNGGPCGDLIKLNDVITGTICRNADYIFHTVFFNNDLESCQISISSPDCSDKAITVVHTYSTTASSP
jgi:hypothetical protein